MTIGDQIQYCAILAGTVTIGLALLDEEIKKQKRVLKRFMHAFVYYGIPLALMTFVLLQFFSNHFVTSIGIHE